MADCTIPYSYIGIRNLFLKYILKISENYPLILVFDNVQYMDPMSLELLTLLIRREEKKSDGPYDRSGSMGRKDE